MVRIIGNIKAHKKQKIESDEKDSEIIESKMLKTRNSHKMKRAFSESKVLDIIDNETFEQNDCFHFISSGDVDSFSFLKAISRKQKINYVLLSTWCIGKQDILDIEEMIVKKKVKNFDVYGGEILPRTYAKEFILLKEVIEKNGGRVAVFNNHSKVYVVFGEKFDCVIESSANVNTNPRTEQTVITISKELAVWYKEFYDGIKSFV